jgi:hypothetical protein
MITAHIAETRSGSPCVELRDGDKVVLKAYASSDERRVRIVLSELVNMKQTLIDDEAHWLEFSRDPDSSMPNAHRAPIAASKVKCLYCNKPAGFIIKNRAVCVEHRSKAHE